MKNIKLDSILLIILVIPFIMGYRISPEETPYWLFGLIFFGLGAYLLLDLLNLSKKTYSLYKSILLWLLILIVLGTSFGSSIIVRHRTSPIYMIHDIILQQESAIRFLLHGKNPYAVTYFGTPLEQWHYSDTAKNPALYHFVMQPFYLIFAIPFYFLSNFFFGYFDGRIPLLFLFFITLIFAYLIYRGNDDVNKKFSFLILLAFNPAMLSYTLEGRSDIFMFAFLFVGLYLLQKNRLIWSSIIIALSFAVKQSVWPIFPFYVTFLLFKLKGRKKILKILFFFSLTFLIIVLPFYFWNEKAFINSTISYLSGNVENSYPVSGYGFGMVLNQFGVIKNVNSYYPFIIWQAIFGIPVFFFLYKFFKKNPTVKVLIIVYGIFLFIYWYFSRYFNNSHLGYLSLVFITAYFWPEQASPSQFHKD